MSGKDKRIIGVVVRTWGRKEVVIGHLYMDQEGAISSCIAMLEHCDCLRPISQTSEATAGDIDQLMRPSRTSMARC